MNKEENIPASYGEPWHFNGVYIRNSDCSPAALSTGDFNERDRIIACVNACQGITDPVEAIKAVVETLQGIANAKPSEWEDPTDFEAWAKSRARSTLAKLNNTAL